MAFAGIELGGTKVNVAVGTGPGDLRSETRLSTTTPAETLGRILEVVGGEGIEAVGIATFGPVELRLGEGWGIIGDTPKPGWSHTDLAGPLATLGVPIVIDTDVNGAALGEATWGAARELSSCVYMTVGTGVGAGAIVGGSVVHGLVHPEMGHVSVVRRPDDRFPGVCPFHGDCLEGMASGPAVEARLGVAGPELSGSEVEAAAGWVGWYVAAGLRNIVYTLAPERLIIGGGVSKLDGFHDAVRQALGRQLGGYPGYPEHGSPGFVVPPELGDRSGVLGALALAAAAS